MANPKLGAKSVPGVACYPLVTHKKFSNKFWGSHNWCPWTHILDSHIGQSYWTVIMTVLFFIVPVQYDCPVCEMCLNKPSSSHKNVRPLFIVKIWILGYNGNKGHLSVWQGWGVTKFLKFLIILGTVTELNHFLSQIYIDVTVTNVTK